MGLTQGGLPRQSPVVPRTRAAIPTFDPQLPDNFRGLPSFNPVGDLATAQAFTQLADTMGNISQMVLDAEKNRVATEAFQAGRSQGFEQGFDIHDLPEPGTIAGDNYRKGAIQSFTSQLEQQRVAAFDQAIEQSQGDPDVLQGALQNWIEAATDDLPDEVRVPFLEQTQPKMASIVTRTRQAFFSEQRKQQIEDAEAQFELYKREAVQYAFPTNASELKSLEVSIAQGIESIRQRTDKTPAQKEVMLAEFNNAVSRAAILGQFDNAPNQEGVEGNKFELLEAFINGKPADFNIVATPDKTAFEQMEEIGNRMEAKISDLEWVAKRHQQELTLGQETALALEKIGLEDGAKDATTTESELVAYAEAHPGVGGQWLGRQLDTLRKARLSQDQKNEEALRWGNALKGGVRIFVNPNDRDQVDSYNEAYERFKANAKSNNQGYVRPVDGGHISSKFSKSRKNPVTGKVSAHNGDDFAVPVGTPVRSTKTGRVIKVGQDDVNGKFVVVDHGGGETSHYGHLGSVGVSVGDTVQQREQIARSGNTGRSTGPHLHFVIKRNGVAQDPEPLLAQAQQQLSPAEQQEKERADQDTDFRLDVLAMRSSGLVPRTLEGKIRAWVRNGTNEDVLRASKYIEFIMDNNVQVGQEFTTEDLTLATLIREKIRVGINPLDAVVQAREEIDPVNDAVKAKLGAQFDEIAKKPENQLDKVFGIDNGLFSFLSFGDHPDFMAQKTRARAEAEWDRLLREFWDSSNGNESVMRRVAADRMKKKWGKSQINGLSRVMAYPPEQFYSVGPDNSWMKKQLFQFVMSRAALSRGLKDGEAWIVADDQTIREVNDPRFLPSYGVMYVNPSSGMPERLNVRFSPDPTKVIAHMEKQAQKQAEEALEAAKRKRELALAQHKIPETLRDFHEKVGK